MSTTEAFRKAAGDPAHFGKYYLSHYFTRPSPPFHRQLSELWRRRVMKGKDPLSDCAAMLTEKGTLCASWRQSSSRRCCPPTRSSSPWKKTIPANSKTR